MLSTGTKLLNCKCKKSDQKPEDTLLKEGAGNSSCAEQINDTNAIAAPGTSASKYLPNTTIDAFHGTGSGTNISTQYNFTPNQIPKAVIEESSTSEKAAPLLQDSSILSQIWLKDRARGKKLLNKIRESKVLSYDGNGILSLEGQLQGNLKLVVICKMTKRK